ncbi:signal peptide peptidase SppA [candidate division LCP-89 bacterium B3_LCP]|uniref:Signal peptide peptidase SppA n=1 Tax=candidate division LCP-89 bacterium B3_LCP TaxID=2012998 RepID=A0A532UXM7_UNCL8|nr:MAG: signal peptide peptidase SppA [candidate division LCP-89 bacterium B3_LCP]
MKKIITILSIMLLIVSVSGQSVTLPSNSAAVTDNAVSIFSNPAWLGVRSGMELSALMPYNDATTSRDRAVLVKLGQLGFAGEFVKNDIELYNRYTLAHGFDLGGGLYAGMAHHWYRAIDRPGSWDIGIGYRPFPFLSAGAVAFDVNEPTWNGMRSNASYNLALALRPFGYRWTLSGDVLLTESTNHSYGEELDPRIRFEAIPFDGIRLLGEYRTESAMLSFGVGLSLGNLTVGNFNSMDEAGEPVSNVSYVSLSSAKHRNIFTEPKRQMVEITIGGEILEADPGFVFPFTKRGKTLRQLRQEIAQYADDPKVSGLLITFEAPKYGLAQAQQIRRALEECKANGKKLVGYAEFYSQKEYYLASVCDELYLMPVGFVDLRGLAAVMGYWKGTLDKLGINFQVVQAGEYKTAANMLTQEDATNAEAEMINWLLDDIYDQLCTQVGEGRGWQLDEVKTIVDGGPYNCHRALDNGLVDDLLYYDQIRDNLKAQQFRPVSEGAYWRSPIYAEEWHDQRIPRVAIIYAEGPIFSGESGSSFFGDKRIGSKTITEAIRHAREDKSIDAIIMRVNSPGGSAFPSEAIYREVRRSVTDEKNRKPFIVSMGNVAGSGGYYIACAADTIIAEESTVTGSIGVLGGKFCLAGLYEKIYLNTHTFKRGEHADATSSTRPFSDEEMAMLQQVVEQFYQDFVERVAESRDMDIADVDAIGEGRVWTGRQAVERGLVDLIGGMDVALAVTRSRLGLEETVPLEVEFYPKRKPFFNLMTQELFNMRGQALPDVLSDAVEPLSLMAELYNGEPLMFMPYQIEVK